MSTLITILFFCGLILILIAGGYYTLRKGDDRSKKIKKIASSLGFSFFQEPQVDLLSRMESFELFKGKPASNCKNILRQDKNGLIISTFDYGYIANSGKDPISVNFTATIFETERFKIPRFYMRPEGLFEKIEGLFGNEDIDFPESPDFSKSYLLRGEDPVVIKNFFNKDILDFFSKNKNYSLEGNGKALLIYKLRDLASPNDILQVLQERIEIYKLFREHMLG